MQGGGYERGWDQEMVLGGKCIEYWGQGGISSYSYNFGCGVDLWVGTDVQFCMLGSDKFPV